MTRSTLTAAIDRYRAAEAACEEYDRDVHTPRLDAFASAVANVPHHRTTASFVNMGGERVTLTTDGVATVIASRRVMQDVKDGHLFGREITPENAEYFATIRELVIAADKREIELERLRSEHRIEEARDSANDLSVSASAARDEAFGTPALDLADLLIKVELIEEADAWDQAGEHLLADVRRLAGEGR